MTSVEGLIQAAAGFVVADVDLAAEPAAAAAARQSLDDSGLLLPSHGAGGDRAPAARAIAATRTHHTLTTAMTLAHLS